MFYQSSEGQAVPKVGADLGFLLENPHPRCFGGSILLAKRVSEVVRLWVFGRKPVWLFLHVFYQSGQGWAVPKMGPNRRFLGGNLFSLLAPLQNRGRLLAVGL